MTQQPDETPISHQTLNDLLEPLGVLLNPAELQGLLCGKLCGGANPSEVDWLLEAVEELDFTQAPDESVRDALTQLFRATRAQLVEEAFAFQPLLPGDTEPVSDRVRCLGQWCHGFLVGFGSAGHTGDSDLSPEARETLADLAAIAQVELDEEESAAAAESDYAEVVEHVRMAAVSLLTEFGAEALIQTQDSEPGESGQDEAESPEPKPPEPKPSVH